MPEKFIRIMSRDSWDVKASQLPRGNRGSRPTKHDVRSWSVQTVRPSTHAISNSNKSSPQSNYLNNRKENIFFKKTTTNPPGLAVIRKLLLSLLFFSPDIRIVPRERERDADSPVVRRGCPGFTRQYGQYRLVSVSSEIRKIVVKLDTLANPPMSKFSLIYEHPPILGENS